MQRNIHRSPPPPARRHQSLLQQFRSFPRLTYRARLRQHRRLHLRRRDYATHLSCLEDRSGWRTFAKTHRSERSFDTISPVTFPTTWVRGYHSISKCVLTDQFQDLTMDRVQLMSRMTSRDSTWILQQHPTHRVTRIHGRQHHPTGVLTSPESRPITTDRV